MGEIYVARCPICLMSKRSKDKEKLFPENGERLPFFLKIQEVGGKIAGSNPRGRGRGSAKGKIETKRQYTLREVKDMEEFSHVRERLVARLRALADELEIENGG
ncbi:hypothetical protein AKJ66_01495 [candidate division MSBL1 archaeon SCGC-AAA259E22]|uniref:Uncharacterized protein n=1 Tax=candidate division MSBL1 archaeon SCGC-AAA259E22 TaxID=1698265 RepID=A0A133UHI8_9EURY|nr:hypothetical protein AKJ66_01495 [candidate division MSBL1 archaeon SCGC-AAA259E22]